MTAVPPRPAAPEISACSPDCGPDQDGGHWHQIVAPERMVWAGYPRYLGRPPAPDATAGDGLREVQSQLYALLGGRTSTPLGAEWTHERLRRLVTDVLALPALRDVLAAAEAHHEALAMAARRAAS